MVLVEFGLEDSSAESSCGGFRDLTGDGDLDLSDAAITPRLLDARDSGKGGIGGARSTRLVGLWGLSVVVEADFL